MKNLQKLVFYSFISFPDGVTFRSQLNIGVLRHNHHGSRLELNPLVNVDKKLLKMAIETVDWPTKMVIFHGYVNVYQRVISIFTNHHYD